MQFVHLSGTHDEPFLRESYEENGQVAKVMSFCNQMELAYSAADVVVGRSGASTLTEIAAFGLPSILIPYPHAAGNHQWLQRARVRARRRGAAGRTVPAVHRHRRGRANALPKRSSSCSTTKPARPHGRGNPRRWPWMTRQNASPT